MSNSQTLSHLSPPPPYSLSLPYLSLSPSLPPPPLSLHQGTGLQGQAVFRSKLTFRPHSTDSQTHRKMTLSIADRFSKAQKIRVLPAVGKDPESQRLERIKV